MFSISRVMLPILAFLIITTAYSNTYYLNYGVVMETKKLWWEEKPNIFVDAKTPTSKPSLKITLRNLIENQTTVFIKINGTLEQIKGKNITINNNTLRINFKNKGEEITLYLIGNLSIEKIEVYKGNITEIPQEKKGKVIYRINKTKEEENIIISNSLDESNREKIKVVFNLSKEGKEINLPSITDVLMILVAGGIIAMLAFLLRLSKPKEEKKRELTPYIYKIEFKKPPKEDSYE